VTDDVTHALPVGSKTRSMGRTITEGEFCLLNTLSWSISELHTNREKMAETAFGERLLAGTMLLAVTQGMHDSSDGLRELEETYGVQVTRTLRLQAKFRAPVMPGDTLWVETELVAAEPTDDASVGVIVFRDTATNQRTETVAELERRLQFRRVAPA
jgi:acyl dehydratase